MKSQNTERIQKKINVYLDPENESKGLHRVSNALIKYAPENINIVDDPELADLIIIHAIGRQEGLESKVMDMIKPYAIVQYAVRSTQKPHTAHWMGVWGGATLVWSYYDLIALCEEDGVEPLFNFYHSALGADDAIFKKTNDGNRRFIIASSGLSYLTESVRECIIAAEKLDMDVFHLGSEIGRSKLNVLCKMDISDEELANYYNECHFVSGLRRVEGFELPAAEGILCGARPIMFDQPHYRKWFDGLAEFIPEEPRPEVVRSLVNIFRRGTRGVTPEEIEEARKRFNWSTIVNNFWERLVDEYTRTYL